MPELRPPGPDLDPTETQDLAEGRRVLPHTRAYASARAFGFTALIGVVVAHNLVVFGTVAWGTVAVFAVACWAYTGLSWLALHRWSLRVDPIRDRDLRDLSFVADLVFWAWAIHAMGGPHSLLWFLPLLRVADYHDLKNVWLFAHLAPLVYLAGAYWPPRPPAVAVAPDLLRAAFLYGAALYLAWRATPAQRLREQRRAARWTVAGLRARLTERTERLVEARRSRGALLDELRGGIRPSLIQIVGFSRFLLRDEGLRSEARRSYLERIHEDARSALRALDSLPGRTAKVWPSVSLSRLLRAVAEEEAAHSEAWREPAVLELPDGDVGIRADEARLRAMFRHLLATGRHFHGGAPRVALEVDPATGLPDAVVMRCAAPALAGGAPLIELFNPFSEAATGDPQEMTARMELSLARSIGESLGYQVAIVGDGAAAKVTVQLR